MKGRTMLDEDELGEAEAIFLQALRRYVRGLVRSEVLDAHPPGDGLVGLPANNTVG